MDKNTHPFGPGSHAPLAEVHQMPACYPIKGNTGSMKYHRPDSTGYANTKAEVWFDSPSAAEAAGFKLAGSHPDGSNPANFEPGGANHPCDVAAVNANRTAAMGTGSGTTTTVAGAAGAASGAGEITVDGDSTIDGSGLSGGAKAAGIAGAAGVAGAAAAGMAGKADMPDVSMPDMPDAGDVKEFSIAGGDVSAPGIETDIPDMGDASMPDVDVDGKGIGIGGAAAAGAAGVAGAAGLAAAGGKDALGKVTGAAGDVGGKVTGAAGDLGGKATGAVSGAGASLSGAASTGRDKVTATGGKVAASGTAAGASIRNDVRFDDDDDDGAGLAGCLGKWWWLLALIAAIVILGLLLSQCNFGGDDTAATPVAETSTTTEAPTTTTEAPTTTTEAPETTTEAPETTTTTEAPEPEPENLAAIAGATSPVVAGVLGPLGLNEALSAEGPVTVFLPSDSGATAALEVAPDLVMNVTDDPLLAQSILGFHVVPGTFTSDDLADGATLVTSTGLELTVADGAVNGIEIITVDLEGSNGVIHVIEGILMPPAEPQLAVTGASSEILGALGAVLLITGGAFVVTSRRREEEAAA